MIENAKLEDLEEVYQLICTLEQKQIHKETFVEKYRSGLTNPDVIYLVARKEYVVGFLSFQIHHYLHHDFSTGEIVELVVLPEYRSLQIGHLLLEEIEKKAKELELEELELSTSTYRNRAHHFYEKHGYIMNHYNYTKCI